MADDNTPIAPVTHDVTQLGPWTVVIERPVLSQDHALTPAPLTVAPTTPKL